MTERNCHQVDSNRNVPDCSLSGALMQPSEPKLVCEGLPLFSPKHKSFYFQIAEGNGQYTTVH